MQYLLKFKTWIDYFIEFNWSNKFWIEYSIELNWSKIILNCIFYWIESWQFSFESKIELNRFRAKFNHWLNRQIVPPRASGGRALKKATFVLTLQAVTNCQQWCLQYWLQQADFSGRQWKYDQASWNWSHIAMHWPWRVTPPRPTSMGGGPLRPVGRDQFPRKY